MLDAILSRLPQILTPIAVITVIQLLRRYCASAPVPPMFGEAPVPLSELDRRFARTQWLVTGLFLGCAACVGLLSWLALRGAHTWFASLEGAAAYRLYPSEAIWWFFPGFGSLTIGWLVMEKVLPYVLGKETAQVYLYWTNAKAGFNASKVFQWGASLIAVPIGVLTLFAVPVHTTFHEAEMRIRPYASFRSTTYRYSQIRSLTTTDGFKDRLGEFVPDPCILIGFSDGTTWSSGDNLRDPDHSINWGLKAFLAEKSNVSFQHKPLERDLSAE